MARRDINNTETAMAQSDATIDEQTLVIRPAMSNDVAHPFKHIAINDAS
jgi:hypothetical protein